MDNLSRHPEEDTNVVPFPEPAKSGITIEEALDSDLTSMEQKEAIAGGLIKGPLDKHDLEFHDDDLRLTDGNSISTIRELERLAFGAALAKGHARKFLDVGPEPTEEPRPTEPTQVQPKFRLVK